MIIAAVDLDGTLLRSDCTISDYSRRIIEEAISNNILIIPTSGRSFRNISSKIKGIKGIRYVISSNGSVITDCQDEKIIYTAFPQFADIDSYSRYDHSIGVALIIWHFTHDRKQAIAGLLHDVASPVFAHVVDFMHGDYLTQEST